MESLTRIHDGVSSMQQAIAKVRRAYAVGGAREVLYRLGRRLCAPLRLRRLIRDIQDAHGADLDAVVQRTFQHYHDLVGPTQVPDEITRLLHIVQQRRPRIVVEIGTCKGGTLLFFTRAAAEDARLISIDLPGGIHGGGYAQWRAYFYRQFAMPKQTIQLLRLDAHQRSTCEHLRSLLGSEQIDFLFIDGDHRYEGVRADFELYSPLVRPGGIIAFHDIVPFNPATARHTSADDNPLAGVDAFWKEVKTNYRHDEFIANPDQSMYGIGVLYL